MNNLLSYCGLVDARISASEKDLPVTHVCFSYKIPLSLLLQQVSGSLLLTEETGTKDLPFLTSSLGLLM